MTRFAHHIVWLLGLILVSAASAQDKLVSIYLEPDENGTVYFKESMKKLNKLDPKPLLDGEGAGKGWMFVLYPAKYVGYVAREDIAPGPTVTDGSKAFLRPDPSSPQLAVILDGDAAEVAREEGNWAVVYFEGQAPAYFRSEAQGGAQTIPAAGPASTTQKSVSVTKTQTPPPQPQSAPASQTPDPQAAPAPKPKPRTATVSDARTGATTSVTTTPVLEEVVMQEAPIPSAPVSRPSGPSPSVERYVQGTIKPVTAWDRLFGTKYEYRLLDQQNETIAYVVLDRALLFGSVERYWDKTVEVTGVVRRISGSVPWEVKASNIRILR